MAVSKRKRPTRSHHDGWLLVLALILAGGGWYYMASSHSQVLAPSAPPAATPTPAADSGHVLSVESVHQYSAAEAAAVARENYGPTALPVTTGITKVTFRYRSYDLDGTPITIYGRAYLPAAPAAQLPVLAFAPGTTGIGDQCAGSLEQPQTANWGNYDSHMVMYASQGYAAVITDYEGLRDSGRLHHYMVGELEGRAVLDSVRGLEELPQAAGRIDTRTIFAAGYSQGGHAAFWADKIQASYAPELPIKGVVGFGPVMSVKATLTAVTHAANINWFGPYVLTSYMDYYHRDYGLDRILLPQRAEHLAADVQAHCINTVLPFWGSAPQGVYTPAFIQAMNSGDWSAYPTLERDLDRNLTGDQTTVSAKLINEGEYDNVVLPAQQQQMLGMICAQSRGPVQLHIYPGATHYNTMVQSLHDTLDWMRILRAGQPAASTCGR